MMARQTSLCIGGALALLSLAGADTAWAQLGDGFVPLSSPCVAFDTRSATAGKMAPNESRTFHIVGATSDFASQGGAAMGCGVPGFSSGSPVTRSVLINVIAIAADGAGDASIWAAGGTEPTGGVVNYQKLTPQLNNANAVVTGVRQDTEGDDVSIRTRTSGAHVRGVILGYFTDITGITGAEIASDTVTSANIQDGTLTSSDINDNSIQARVSNFCAPGSYIRAISAGGVATCELDTVGITGITTSSGSGLDGGCTTGNCDLSVDPTDINGSQPVNSLFFDGAVATLADTDWVTISSVTINPAKPGVVALNADAMVLSSGLIGPGQASQCNMGWTTSDTGSPTEYSVAVPVRTVNFPSTYVGTGVNDDFSVAAGSQTFYLRGRRPFSSVGTATCIFYNPTATATFVAN